MRVSKEQLLCGDRHGILVTIPFSQRSDSSVNVLHAQKINCLWSLGGAPCYSIPGMPKSKFAARGKGGTTGVTI